jgi:hypothetical protein
MMSAIQDNTSFDSSSQTHSSPEDNYTRATTPELDENDGATSADSLEEDDDSESVVRDDESELDDDESEVDDDASIASYDSEFPDEYIIHDHEATRTGKYSAIHCFQRA